MAACYLAEQLTCVRRPAAEHLLLMCPCTQELEGILYVQGLLMCGIDWEMQRRSAAQRRQTAAQCVRIAMSRSHRGRDGEWGLRYACANVAPQCESNGTRGEGVRPELRAGLGARVYARQLGYRAGLWGGCCAHLRR